MIFVTLGTQDKEFRRLVLAVHKYVSENNVNEKIIIQSGNTKVNKDLFSEYSNVEVRKFMDKEEFEKIFKKADIIITHAGVGTILTGLDMGKKMIVAARLKRYKEHVNDHQLQLLDNFVDEGYVIPLEDFYDLAGAIEKVHDFVPKKFKSNNKKFNDLLEKEING